MNAQVGTLRRSVAWPIGNSGFAGFLQWVVFLALIWYASSQVSGSVLDTNKWNGDLVRQIAWSLPSQLAKDFAIVREVNAQIVTRPIDPAKTRLTLDGSEEFWRKAAPKSDHFVYIVLQNQTIHVHFLVQNPSDTYELHWLENIGPFVQDYHGWFVPTGFSTARAREDRAIDVTYKFVGTIQTDSADLLSTLAFIAVFGVLCLAYYYVVRPTHLGIARLIDPNQKQEAADQKQEAAIQKKKPATKSK